MCVDLDPNLIAAARENLRTAGMDNCVAVAAQSARFCRLFLRKERLATKQAISISGESGVCSERGERALSSGVPADFDFHCIVLDPPRAGLDAHTRRLAMRFEHILYVSCNASALARDLEKIARTHSCERIAMFDHFPYTAHIETAVFLRRRTMKSCCDEK